MGKLNIVEILRIGVIGLGFLLAVLAYRLLTNEQKREEIRPSLIKATYVFMFFSIILSIIGLGSEFLKHQFYEGKPDRKTAGENLYGLKLHRVHWEHNYKPNGDFLANFDYKVTNTSKINLFQLIPGTGSWFGWNIDAEHHFEIQGSERDFFDLSSSCISRNETTVQYPDGTARKITSFYWFPRVNPPIKPKQTFKYRVQISTRKTEGALFTPEGSFAGMRTSYNTDVLSCRINAPSGYRLHIKSFMTKDKSGIKIPNPDTKPVISPAGTHIEWEVNNPKVDARYLIKLGAEKLR